MVGDVSFILDMSTLDVCVCVCGTCEGLSYCLSQSLVQVSVFVLLFSRVLYVYRYILKCNNIDNWTKKHINQTMVIDLMCVCVW